MFDGFTPEAVEFLWGIRFNNERAWFLEHKEQYLSAVYQPMTELSEEILAFLRKKRPGAGFIRKVTRIYRDARRLYGRGPYKDHLWFSVEHPSEDWTGKPTFWFELTPDGWSYGLGYWRPTPAVMAKLRGKISRDPAVMEKLTRRIRRSPEFTLETENYRRPRAAAPSKALEPWYQGKTFSLIHDSPLTEELYSRALVERLEKGYAFLLPFYDYFRSVDAEPDPRNPESETKGDSI